jgi:hypothetical protein
MAQLIGRALEDALKGEGAVGGRQQQRREDAVVEGEQPKGQSRKDRRKGLAEERAALLSTGSAPAAAPAEVVTADSITDIPAMPTHGGERSEQPKGTQMNKQYKSRPAAFTIIERMNHKQLEVAIQNDLANRKEQVKGKMDKRGNPMRAFAGFNAILTDKHYDRGEQQHGLVLNFSPSRDADADGVKAIWVCLRGAPRDVELADKTMGKGTLGKFAEKFSRFIGVEMRFDWFLALRDKTGGKLSERGLLYLGTDPSDQSKKKMYLSVSRDMAKLRREFAEALAEYVFVSRERNRDIEYSKARKQEREQSQRAALAAAADLGDILAVDGTAAPTPMREPRVKRPRIPAEYDRKSLLLLRHGPEADLALHLSSMPEQTARVILVDWEESNKTGVVVGAAARVSLGEGMITVQVLEKGGKYGALMAGIPDDTVTTASAVIAAANGNAPEGDEYAKLFGAELALAILKRERREAAPAVDQAVRDDQAQAAAVLEVVVAEAGVSGDVEAGGDDADLSAEDQLIAASSAA